jgi:partner of Y14 and mago
MDRATAPARSGIKQTSDGSAVIPSSTRADGTKRKEIRVRPGYTPPEDVETYKNQRASAFANRAKAGIPGAEGLQVDTATTDSKSKNAKRREAAKKKAHDHPSGDDLADALHKQDLGDQTEDKLKANWRDPEDLQTNPSQDEADEVERQKKIRNTLKKLKAVRELKEKKSAGEKLSIDQVAKIGKEGELLRDLQKLKYEGPEMGGSDGEKVEEIVAN